MTSTFFSKAELAQRACVRNCQQLETFGTGRARREDEGGGSEYQTVLTKVARKVFRLWNDAHCVLGSKCGGIKAPFSKCQPLPVTGSKQHSRKQRVNQGLPLCLPLGLFPKLRKVEVAFSSNSSKKTLAYFFFACVVL